MALASCAKPRHVTARAAKPPEYISTVTIRNPENQTPFEFHSASSVKRWDFRNNNQARGSRRKFVSRTQLIKGRHDRSKPLA
jgi:hypothetical protein